MRACACREIKAVATRPRSAALFHAQGIHICACAPHSPAPPRPGPAAGGGLQIRAIRKKMTEIMAREATSCDLKDLVAKLIPEAIGKDIEKACQGIYPLQNTFIRKVKVLKVRRAGGGGRGGGSGPRGTG